jgi:phospholipid transport system substrate-binding protein
VLASFAVAAPAHAEDAQGFIEHEHHKLDQLLHQPASPARDTQINAALDGFVDYDELARRAFGEPCPAAIPSCEDLWASYNDAQKVELRDLLKQLVEKNYRKNLTKTLDYDVSYKGSKGAGGDTRVLTEAKSKTNPREEPFRVDYVVKQTANGYRVVDIITEGSVLTKDYYEQFLKKQRNEGYDAIVSKLKEKIAKKD